MQFSSSHTPNFSVPVTVLAPALETDSDTATALRFSPKAAPLNLSEENATPAGAASGLNDVGYLSLQWYLPPAVNTAESDAVSPTLIFLGPCSHAEYSGLLAA